jgi:hypothetical protein
LNVDGIIREGVEEFNHNEKQYDFSEDGGIDYTPVRDLDDYRIHDSRTA